MVSRVAWHIVEKLVVCAKKWEFLPEKIRNCAEDCMPSKMQLFKVHCMVSAFRMVLCIVLNNLVLPVLK